jgi:hypothetical protein
MRYILAVTEERQAVETTARLPPFLSRRGPAGLPWTSRPSRSGATNCSSWTSPYRPAAGGREPLAGLCRPSPRGDHRAHPPGAGREAVEAVKAGAPTT